MSKINDKLGLRAAGKRPMMKTLPEDRALRAKVTSARCPVCASVGAYLSKVTGREGWLVCSWCHHTWELPK
jgi:formate dehydrogenase maturation protein FdhE